MSTGYVACRSPSHAVTRRLIDYAGVPIAAPSANKFGHVSPTRADHVFTIWGGEDVWVIDTGERDEKCNKNDDNDVDGDDMNYEGVAEERGTPKEAPRDSLPICEVGVESTVAKIKMMTTTTTTSTTTSTESTMRGIIMILRHGAVSAAVMRRYLRDAGLSEAIRVVTEANRSVPENHDGFGGPTTTAAAIVVVGENEDGDDYGSGIKGRGGIDDVGAAEVMVVAPGQTVRHYSPDVRIYVVSGSRYAPASAAGGGGAIVKLSVEERDILSRSVVVNFGGRLL